MITQAHTGTTAARLGLLGGFTCRLGDDEVRLAPTAERVVAYLALARRRVRRHELAGTLWPQDPDRQGLTRLRTVLWKVPSPVRAALVCVDAGTVGLHPAAAVDLYALDRDADEAAETDLLARGELLPGWSDDWVLVERARHRQLHLHALEDRSASCCREGRYADALRFGLEAVAQEPLRESARRRVIEVHLAEGNAAETLAEYEAFRRLLRTELGLAPSPALRDLVRPLLGRPADQ
ncbi:BTAD domain-containing putative transcriptional regulator [Actinomycetospora sp. TBRC 11914]|uniref:AfsR/SARP family transcriptional regulator n=1 Tax=Actinomycetospora sp. TBRC 11914 TaxID=2729387 RepID=UPI00145E0BD8|nr:BTAD domain-containing putative transcriptional regulator [Actinomycetospora sp. TBRC 11914]NMO90696.1 SARP family transcriptional regulator [Actinomycetospora sp. TBRC 11914]